MRQSKKSFLWRSLFLAIVLLVYVLLAGKSWRERSHNAVSLPQDSASKESQDTAKSFTRRLLAHKIHRYNCTPPSILEFPNDLLDQKQRQKGGVVINFLAAFYMFWAIAIVCDDYFVPCLEIICDRLNLQTDVAGATFMALGSSAPELSASVIGVFITKGDIGVGTIIGSAVFNVLFVIGVCGVGAGTVLYLAWWPMVRDIVFYLFSLVALMLVIMDNIVVWSEATAMVSFYSVYLLIMYFNPRIEAWLYKVTKTSSPEYKSDLHASNGNEKKQEKQDYQPLPSKDDDEKVQNVRPENEKELGEKDRDTFDSGAHLAHHHEYEKHVPHEVPDLTLGNPFTPPKNTWPFVCWLLGLPINISFYYTIPDVKKENCRKWVVFSFVVCIVWIGLTSYVLVWMVTVIGYTFGIPDTVMGLSLVAFGSSVPDCLSSLFVARKGDGDMAVSHTVGSNVFDILLCLGLPWLIKTTAYDYDSAVIIDSHGLFISCFFILGSIAITLIIIHVAKWKLDKKVGYVYLVTYFIFMVISIVVEMMSFTKYNPPMCKVNI